MKTFISILSLLIFLLLFFMLVFIMSGCEAAAPAEIPQGANASVYSPPHDEYGAIDTAHYQPDRFPQVQGGWPLSKLYEDLAQCKPTPVAFISHYDPKTGLLLTYYEQKIVASHVNKWTIILVQDKLVIDVQRFETELK